MMKSHNQMTIDAVLQECAVALFDAYGVRAVAMSEVVGTARGVDLAGTIGFVCAEFSGSVLVATHADVLRATGQTNATPDSLCDWVAELANQLLGRVKNQLLAYGVTLHVSTPIVVEGRALHVKCGRGSAAHFFQLTCEHGQIAVRVDVEEKVPFRLERRETYAAELPAVEGEVLLF